MVDDNDTQSATFYGREAVEGSSGRFAAKNLPDGWIWSFNDDGSGSLCGPDGEDFFSFDLATHELFDYDGSWVRINGLSPKFLDQLEAQVSERYLPFAARAAALEEAGCFCAFKAGRPPYEDYPGGFFWDEWTHVAISPDLVVDATTFDSWLLTAHALERENFSDFTTDARHLAQLAAQAAQAGKAAFEYEHANFDVTAVSPADEILTEYEKYGPRSGDDDALDAVPLEERFTPEELAELRIAEANAQEIRSEALLNRQNIEMEALDEYATAIGVAPVTASAQQPIRHGKLSRTMAPGPGKPNHAATPKADQQAMSADARAQTQAHAKAVNVPRV